MDYTFCVGIRIVSREAYSSLDEAQRAEVRTALLAQVTSIEDRMGTFDTESPREYIHARIAADPGGDWSVGVVAFAGPDYFYNPRTGLWECQTAYQLLNQSNEFEATVTVDSVLITANYSIYQTAVN